MLMDWFFCDGNRVATYFPTWRVIAECNVSWTFNPTGGHLVGNNGETFAIVFKRFPSQPFIRES